MSFTGSIYGSDWPSAVSAYDDTQLLNLTNTTYVSGNPEVGVYFTMPPSGRVLITVHGGARDNTNDNRVFFSVEVRENGTNGTVLMSPAVASNGFGIPGSNADYLYASRTFLLLGGSVYGTNAGIFDLTNSGAKQFYARVMHSVETTTGSTADIANRGIIVEPVS